MTIFELLGILLIVYLIIDVKLKKREKMSNGEKKSSECSKISINKAYEFMIFDTPKFVR